MDTMSSRLFVALDFDNADDAIRLVERLGETVRHYKVGMQLFYKEGPSLLNRLQQQGCHIFLDSKFHDIPNTVAGAADSVTSHGVYMFNVHAAGGLKMMQAAKAAARAQAWKLGQKEPLLIAVTQLTSTDEHMLRDEIGIPLSMREAVVRYARLAKVAGLDGVVASGHELEWIREACGNDFITVIPGIRPTGSGTHDQSRTMTPEAAIRQGAHFLVVGRAITQASDPVEATRRILDDMEKGGAGTYGTL